jgi:lipooligosaccharide transport system permease protein
VSVLFLRAFEYWWVHFRSTLRRQLTTSLVQPLLYLGALGLGLGSLIGDTGASSDALGGVEYVAYLAPGLMAAAVMQTTASEALFPVLSAKLWTRQYAAQQATPLGPFDVFAGHLTWMLARAAIATVPFAALLPLAGAWRGWTAPLSLVAAMLTGAASAAPLAALAIGQTRDTWFVMMQRFVLVPMYLLSGTFTPVSALGSHAETIASLTPLYHGVELCRSLALGTAEMSSALLHVTYLSVLTALGVVAARRTFTAVLTEAAAS